MKQPNNHVELGAILLNFLREFEDKKQNAFRLLNEGRIPRPAKAVEAEHIKLYEQQIEDFYRNKIPEKITDHPNDPFWKDEMSSNAKMIGWNDCVDTITAQFNKGDSDE